MSLREEKRGIREQQDIPGKIKEGRLSQDILQPGAKKMVRSLRDLAKKNVWDTKKQATKKREEGKIDDKPLTRLRVRKTVRGGGSKGIEDEVTCGTKPYM